MDRRWTYRPRTSVVLTAATLLAAAGFAAAELAADGLVAGLRALPGTAAVGLLGWAVFARPRVDVDDAGVHVVNPFVTTLVPWAALIDVRTRFTCTFVTPHARVEAFAAPGPGRHAAAGATASDLRNVGPGVRDGRGAVPLGDVPGAPSATVATYVRRRWNELAESGALDLGVADETPVRREVRVGTVVALGLLVATAVVLQLV